MNRQEELIPLQHEILSHAQRSGIPEVLAALGQVVGHLAEQARWADEAEELQRLQDAMARLADRAANAQAHYDARAESLG